jgi:hypothetical protein
MSYWYMSAVPFVILVPFTLALSRLKELPSYAKVIVWLLVFSGMTQLAITFLAEYSVNNMPVFHLYTLGEMLLIVWFFQRLMSSRQATSYMMAVGSLFLVFACLNALCIQGLYHFNTYARSIEALVVISLCFTWFGQQFTADRLSYKDSGLWFVTGLFVYFAASFVLFVISDLNLVLDKYFDWIVWNIHATFVLIMYIFYTIGFLKCR